VWQDEFDGAALDTSVWSAPTIPVPGIVLYTPDAVSVRDGLLRLATYTEGGVHHSAHIETSGKYQPRYGYFEARIRFMAAPGQWGAFWLHTPTYGNPVGDPATAGVEVDIVEYRTTNMEGQNVEDFLAMVLHWDGPTAHKREMRFMRPRVSEPLNGHWHTYAVLWTETEYTFYVDGMPLWTTSAAVSRRDQFICLSTPMNNWAGSPPPGGYGTRETSTTGMEVDWVRVWQKE
jgi:beta-glucanase (GH16 family)